MKSLTYAFAACLLAGSLATSTTAQKYRVPELAEIYRARLVFAKLLNNNEQQANNHVAYLIQVSERSPWDFATLVGVTQRLSVMGFAIGEIDPALIPCGDMAVAVTTDDDAAEERFIRIVVGIALLAGERPAPGYVAGLLDGLTEEGVPVVNFLSESTGANPQKIEEWINTGRIRGPVARKLLLESFTRHYGGLAAKLAEKQRESK